MRMMDKGEVTAGRRRGQGLRRTLASALGIVLGIAAAQQAGAARNEPENVPDPRTRVYPHIEWAKHYEGGKPKVLFVSREGDAWDLYELAMRMDIEFDVFHSGTVEGWFAPATDYYHEGIKLYPELKDDLRQLLQKKWDAIVFLNYGPNRFPPEQHLALMEAIANGTGVVTFNADSWGMGFNYPAVKQTNDASFLATIPLSALTLPKAPKPVPGAVLSPNGVPVPATLETQPEACSLKPVSVRTLGKGRLYAFGPGGGNYFGGPAIHPAAPQEPEELLQAEYFFSIGAKLVLCAAGMGPTVRIQGLDAEGKTLAPNQAASMGVTLDGAFSGSARTVIRTPRNEVVASNEAPVALTAPGMIQVPLAALPAGRYYVDVWLVRGGKVADWGSAAFVVRDPKARIAELNLAERSIPRTAKLAATVVAENAPAGATVSARIRDANGRILVEQKGLPVRSGKASVSLPLDRTREIYHDLEVDLVAGGVVVDTRWTHFYVPRELEKDLVIFTDGDAKNLNGARRFEVFRDYGVTLVEGGSPREALAAGFDLSHRIWLTHCNPMTGGCLSSPAYHRELTDYFRSMSAVYEPYGLKFFNTGDDSGVAGDFCECSPNWMRPLILKLIRKYGEDPSRFYKDHELKSVGELWRMPGSLTLPVLAKMKLLPGDLALFHQAWKETYGTVEAFNRAHRTAYKSFDEIQPEGLADAKPVSPCLIGFRDWAKERYRKIEALNEAWGSTLASFEAITPAAIEALSGARKFGAFMEKTEYLESLFIRHMTSAAAGVKRVLPDAGIGQGAASYGNVLPEVLGALDSSMPYLEYRDIEIIRSIPHRYVGRTIGVYGGKKVPASSREHQFWSTLFAGGNFVWFWSMCTGGLEGDLSMNPGRSGAMLENIREAQGGIARALIQAQRQHDGIGILHSRLSGTLSAQFKDLGTTPSSESAFQSLIEELGLQYRYTWTSEVEAGSLRGGEFKVLLLPYAQCLTEKEASEIRRFVKGGGLLIADLRAGTHDAHGRPLKEGALDEVFGIRSGCEAVVPAKGDMKWTLAAAGGMLAAPATIPGLRGDRAVTAGKAVACAAVGEVPAVLANAFGQGRAIFLNHTVTAYEKLRNRGEAADLTRLWADLLASNGIRARFRAARPDGSAIPGVEMAVFRAGPIDYLTVEKHSYEFEKYPVEGAIALDRACEVYDVRQGKKLGWVDSIPVSLGGLSCAIYALLPYRVGDLAVDMPATVKRGTDADVAIGLGVAEGLPGPHMIRVEVRRPNGERLWPMSKVSLEKGKASVRLPIALNDDEGDWTVTVTDVTTGLSKMQTMKVVP